MQYDLVHEPAAEVYNAKCTLTLSCILTAWCWFCAAHKFAFLAFAFPY